MAKPIEPPKPAPKPEPARDPVKWTLSPTGRWTKIRKQARVPKEIKP